MIQVQSTTTATTAPATLLERSVEERMADAMRELHCAGRTVDDEALSLAGFTSEEIERFGKGARDRANRDLVRRVA